MPTITHFEIPAGDVERAKGFYTGLFGWKIEKHPGPMEYWTVSTTDNKGEKALGGGMMKRQDPNHHITNYVDIPSIDEYTRKVENLGGKIIVPKTPVPGMGYLAVCHDTENNAFGLWETNKEAK